MISASISTISIKEIVDDLLSHIQISSYEAADQQFAWLLTLEDLDIKVKEQPDLIQDFEKFLSLAVVEAYTESPNSEQANWFLQRSLYRINRLNLFWYDSLQLYTNERSTYIKEVRDRIESVWQTWELTHVNVQSSRYQK